MAFDWLSGVKDITELMSGLGNLVKNNRAIKDLLIRELRINIKAFKTAQLSKKIDYDKLLDLLKNEHIKKARESRFTFQTIKRGTLEDSHIRDNRNNRYIGKNCEWLFKNIDELLKYVQEGHQLPLEDFSKFS